MEAIDTQGTTQREGCLRAHVEMADAIPAEVDQSAWTPTGEREPIDKPGAATEAAWTDEACVSLWTDVFEQAIGDLRFGDEDEKEDALEWLNSEEHVPGSFLWICEVLWSMEDADPEVIRERIKAQIRTVPE